MGEPLFNSCDFLLFRDRSVVVIIPASLPKAENFTVSIGPCDVKFRAGYDEIAHIAFQDAEVYDRMLHTSQIGVVESPVGEPFPDCITALAYVEVRGSA